VAAVCGTNAALASVTPGDAGPLVRFTSSGPDIAAVLPARAEVWGHNNDTGLRSGSGVR